MERAQAHTRYRMSVIGTVAGHVAAALGSTVKPGRDGSVLVGEYVDQAQLTGLINRLCSLHIQIRSVEVFEEAS